MDPNALSGQIAQLDQSYNPTDVYNKVTTSLGLPDARTRVQGLQTNLVNTQNAIQAVDPSVTGRTQNYDVTEAQRGRLVNMEKQPLNDTYAKQNQSLGVQQQNLNDLTSQANTQVAQADANYKNKRQSLSDQLATALKLQADRQAQANADRAYAENQRQFNVSAADARAKASSGGSGGAQVNPAQDFLNYIGSQMKAYGGAGNSGTSRQTQDSWANAWFDQNGVSQANRQQYWNLYNKTYNRTDDPTKDWRYKK